MLRSSIAEQQIKDVPTPEEIRQRAFEIHIERGGIHGCDLDGMTSKAKRSETLELHASPIQPHAENASANHAPSHEEIRRRACEIYLERGGLKAR
jgi:hypothetical protein